MMFLVLSMESNKGRRTQHAAPLIRVGAQGKHERHEDEYVLAIFKNMNCGRVTVYDLHS